MDPGQFLSEYLGYQPLSKKSPIHATWVYRLEPFKNAEKKLKKDGFLSL